MLGILGLEAIFVKMNEVITFKVKGDIEKNNVL
jgi:hypothetical protein